MTLRWDKSLRVGAGFGLLLLVLAQQKLCPWLTSPPAVPEPTAAEPRGPLNEAGKTARKRAASPLPYLLPDALVPRWPAAWSQVTARQTTGWHDGVVSCGPRQPTTDAPRAATPPMADLWWWHRFLPRIDFCGAARPAVPLHTFVDPAINTAIIRTGPPRA